MLISVHRPRIFLVFLWHNLSDMARTVGIPCAEGRAGLLTGGRSESSDAPWVEVKIESEGSYLERSLVRLEVRARDDPTFVEDVVVCPLKWALSCKSWNVRKHFISGGGNHLFKDRNSMQQSPVGPVGFEIW